MSRAREVSKVISTVENLDAIAYSSASPSGAEVGDLWVDTSTANPLIKAYDGNEWDTLGSTPVPIITGIAPDNISGSASTAVIINGTNFESGSIVKLIDINSTELFTLSTTFNNARSLQFLTPALTASAGPYDVKVTNPDNQISILENALTVGQSPVWQTTAGSLGNIYNSGRSATTFQLSATDPDSQNVTYSVVSGSLPTNMSMSSSGLISGTAQAVASDTAYSFLVRAIDTVGNYTDRSFVITVKAPIIQSFTNVGTTSWTSLASGSVEVLVVAGGGGGGGDNGGGAGGGGVIYNGSYSVTNNSSYTITVGAGGNRGAVNIAGSNGSNSVFATLTAIGGGGGSGGDASAPAKTGGSGGGGNGEVPSNGASGTTGQGNSGGNGAAGSGGGGGGAGGNGSNAISASVPGNGGAGIVNSISGSNQYYGGGGGGGTENGTAKTGGGLGGIGGGGTGGVGGQDGSPNTGGGGGGSDNTGVNPGNGGSGIIILRY